MPHPSRRCRNSRRRTGPSTALGCEGAARSWPARPCIAACRGAHTRNRTVMPSRVAVQARLHRSGYSDEGVDGPSYLNGPWLKPNLLKAREKYRGSLFAGGEAPLFGSTIQALSGGCWARAAQPTTAHSPPPLAQLQLTDPPRRMHRPPAVLGTGVTLHFRLLRYLIAFFTCATLIMIPAFAICWAGERLNDGEPPATCSACMCCACCCCAPGSCAVGRHNTCRASPARLQTRWTRCG